MCLLLRVVCSLLVVLDAVLGLLHFLALSFSVGAACAHVTAAGVGIPWRRAVLDAGCSRCVVLLVLLRVHFVVVLLAFGALGGAVLSALSWPCDCLLFRLGVAFAPRGENFLLLRVVGRSACLFPCIACMLRCLRCCG